MYAYWCGYNSYRFKPAERARKLRFNRWELHLDLRLPVPLWEDSSDTSSFTALPLYSASFNHLIMWKLEIFQAGWTFELSCVFRIERRQGDAIKATTNKLRPPLYYRSVWKPRSSWAYRLPFSSQNSLLHVSLLGTRYATLERALRLR